MSRTNRDAASKDGLLTSYFLSILALIAVSSVSFSQRLIDVSEGLFKRSNVKEWQDKCSLIMPFFEISTRNTLEIGYLKFSEEEPFTIAQ